MSDFNYNNGSDFNNGGDKPPRKKMEIIITVIVVAMIGMIFLGAKSNNIPLVMGCFFAAFITAFIAAAIQGKKKGAGGAKSGFTVNSTQLGKYYPLLADERTKQHPEVQVLLQYPAVQKAFFDPSSLSNSAITSDPHVQELFLVFDEMLAQGVINGNIYGNFQNQPQAPFQNTAMPADPLQKQRETEEKKKPIRKAGKIMRIIGIGIFLLPFIFVFITMMSGSGSSFATSMLSFVITGACPMGMMLIIVGTIIGR